MIIAVDGNEANVKELVGVSVYTYQHLKYMSEIASNEQQFKIYLRNPPLDFLPKENNYYKYVVVKGPFLWSQIFLPMALYLDSAFDVFFAPAHYIPRYCPRPVVVTIHDLSYFYYPDEFLKKDLYKLTNWTEKAVDRASKIIAVSKNTKKDILKYYHPDESKIEVIYNGYERKATKTTQPMMIKKPFILYNGTIQPRKNIITLVDAFSKFQINYPDFNLILAGKKGWLYEETLEHIKKLGLSDKVSAPGYIPDEELNYLYKNAFCFVMPSLYEGFGIPVLEAMSHQCPVVSSFASSLPEIGGEACLYFDPKSSENLYDKLVELKENPSLRKSLVQKGKERIKMFSWKNCTRATLDLLASIKNG